MLNEKVPERLDGPNEKYDVGIAAEGELDVRGGVQKFCGAFENFRLVLRGVEELLIIQFNKDVILVKLVNVFFNMG